LQQTISQERSAESCRALHLAESKRATRSLAPDKGRIDWQSAFWVTDHSFFASARLHEWCCAT
jgi:sugar lactone lactonase YvrE